MADSPHDPAPLDDTDIAEAMTIAEALADAAEKISDEACDIYSDACAEQFRPAASGAAIEAIIHDMTTLAARLERLREGYTDV